MVTLPVGFVQDREAERRALQTRLDAAKSPTERNTLGQFATSPLLARDILRYARDRLPPDVPIKFLDPAIGTGSFYSAFLDAFASARTAPAVGYEVDPHYGEPARALWTDTPLDVRLTDFTAATPGDEAERATLLICNPPYVRHHHLSVVEKQRLFGRTYDASGMRLSGLAGLYCHFLGLAHAWMTEGGLAGWLIPSEFMDVNYGQEMKRYLLERVTLLHIHRFDPAEAQFTDALVSSVIVWFTKHPPANDHDVAFSFGGTLLEPKVVATVKRGELVSIPKWTRLPLTSPARANGHQGVRLGDLFEIRRGLATGSNAFFILTPQQIKRHELPAEFLRPILPSPRYLASDEILADIDGQPIVERPLFLLNCELHEDEVKQHYPTLWRYFQLGVEEGLSERYLSRHRSPWYAQERRLPAPIVCTYLGRAGTKRGRPFRFILNHSLAIAANVYLMLYPKADLRPALIRQPDLLEQIWQWLNQLDAERILFEGRVYGGGLHKLEPRELANLPADEILRLVEEEIRPRRQAAMLLERRAAYRARSVSRAE